MKKENGAFLSPEAGNTFFGLFLPLLDFVNQTYEVSDVLYDQVRRGHPDTRELKKAADVLWEAPGTINEFIKEVEEQADIAEDDRRILESWCHPLTGLFILERHLSRGSIFIDTERDKVYQVKGITQTWEEMIPYLKPPFPIKATLIPFGDCIISDGLVSPLDVSFGPEYRKSLKQIYLEAKETGRILTKIENKE